MVIVTRIRQPTTVWRCGSCGPESCRVLSCGWSWVSTCSQLAVLQYHAVWLVVQMHSSLNDSTFQRRTSQQTSQWLNVSTCKRLNVSTNVSTSQQRSCGVSCSLVTTSFSCGLGAEVLLLNSTYHAVSINTTVGYHTLVTLSRRTVSHTRIVCVTHWDCVRVAGQPWRVEFSAVTVGTVMLLLVSLGETNSSEKEHSRWYRWSEVGWG